jgi:hypothetical protein
VSLEKACQTFHSMTKKLMIQWFLQLYRQDSLDFTVVRLFSNRATESDVFQSKYKAVPVAFDFGLFRLPDLEKKAYRGCERSIVDAYSFYSPDPTSVISKSRC